MRFRTIFFIFCLGGIFLALSGMAEASAQSEYQRGLSLFKSLLPNEKKAGLRSEWQAVLKPFEKSLALDPKGETAPKCMYFIGRVYEELGRRSFLQSDRDKAFEWFDKTVATFPKHGWADDCLYRKGLIWQEQLKDYHQARLAFEAVVNTYPKSDMAAEARFRLQDMAAVKAEESGSSSKTALEASPGLNSKPASSKAKSGSAQKGSIQLKGIRHWSSEAYTRVVLDLDRQVVYNCQVVGESGGTQLQAQLQDTSVGPDVLWARSIGDGIVSKIQLSEDRAGGTMVILDLERMDNYRVFTLPEPYRVVIDLYGASGGTKSTARIQEADHVQAALADLKAQQHQQGASSSTPVAKSEPQKQVATPKVQTPAKQAPPQTPQIAVSPAQKKFTGSLVEQLGLKVRTIMLDPGHGGKDPGAVANGIREKDINLRLAKIMGKMLQDQGFEVHYTRSTDKFIPLEGRTAMANAKNADLFISLHCNSNPSAKLKGLEIYYLNLATDAQAVRVAARENGVSAKKISDMQFILSDLMINSKINESRQMAALVEQKTLQIVRPKYPLKSQGSRGAFFYVLTGARMPSILVEAGYLTNAQEAALLNTDAYLTTLARGLVGGVMAYKDKLEQVAKQG